MCVAWILFFIWKKKKKNRITFWFIWPQLWEFPISSGLELKHISQIISLLHEYWMVYQPLLLKKAKTSIGLFNLWAPMTKYPFVQATCNLQLHRHATVADGYLIMHLKEPAAVFAPLHVKQASYTRPSNWVFVASPPSGCNRIRPFLIMAFY